VLRFLLAQEQERSPGDLAFDGELGLVEESLDVPCVHLRSLVRKLAAIIGASNLDRRIIEIVQPGLGNDSRGPIIACGLGPDAFDLFEVEWAKIFAVSSVVVAFPGDGNTSRCGRDLEEDHSAVGVMDFVDLDEGDPICRLVGNFSLEAVQAFAVGSE